MSNSDISANGIPVRMIDNFDDTLSNNANAFVLNTDVSSGPGIHYIAVIRIAKNKVFIIDSLGKNNYRPNDDLMFQTFKDHGVSWQFYPYKFQVNDSTRCGWWAVWTIKLVLSLDRMTPRSITNALVAYVGKTADNEDENVLQGAFAGSTAKDGTSAVQDGAVYDSGTVKDGGAINLQGLMQNRIGFKPKVREILEVDGDVPVVQIRACRMPLRRAFSFIIKMISGKSHDTLFHLFMFIKLSNGHQYVMEKNQDINIAPWGNTKVISWRDVQLHSDVTVTMNELLDNAIAKVGETEIFDYEATSRNCQKFVYDVLTSSFGALNDTLKQFILQPVSDLVPKWAKVITYFATSAANRVNQVVEGAGKNNGFAFNLI